jgi:hypothetical protein
VLRAYRARSSRVAASNFEWGTNDFAQIAHRRCNGVPLMVDGKLVGVSGDLSENDAKYAMPAGATMK